MTSIFHRFIEVAAIKPPQADRFVEFAYMQHEIRKSYKQLKHSKGVAKPNDDFLDYWKEIGKDSKEEQVALYFKWVELLQRTLKSTPKQQLKDREGDLYVRKSVIGKWDRRKVRITGLNLQIFSKNLREFPLRCFGIRRSKNKDHFCWVMEVIMQQQESKYKSFHLGTNNIIEFEEWYRDVQVRIDLARMEYFQEAIEKNKEEPLERNEMVQKVERSEKKQKEISVQEKRAPDRGPKMKTLTELVIDQQLKEIEEFEQLDVIEESNKISEKGEEIHPNIFNRIFPDRSIQNFTENPTKAVLIEIEKHHRLYDMQNRVKLFVTITHNISAVFAAISESHRNWNPEIDVFTVKNKISSQNSIIAYQKDKAKGFLYRERDYLFLRHCFTVETEDEKKKIFMIEKSIDSIHTPPFMSVARGEKELIWCIIGDPDEKECLLAVEGLINGGGYMNAQDNRETTIRHFRKLLQLESYLKQAEYSRYAQDNMLFKQNWNVSFKQEEQEEFYSPRQFDGDEEDVSTIKKETEKEHQMKKNDHIIQEQLDEFMKHTSEETKDAPKTGLEGELKCNFSVQDFNAEYKPPPMAADRTIIIPQDYIKVKHRTEAKPKGKEYLSETIRGHHLWKGEWAVSDAGGLNYVDQDKMREQKKVLTFIIKRIGKNILSGKGILNISLPVDIFCRESNIERLANSFGYFPVFLQRVVNAENPLDQMKAILAGSIGSSLIYLTMEKPFNPILGETYQCWIDGCPVYFEQISHHPPIAAYFMRGRGYTISGTVQAKMDLSINSGTGINEGIFTVAFDGGRKFYFTTPPGELSGLTYGQRKLCMVQKTYFWSMEEGLFVELTYNPLSKQRGFFGGGGKNFVGEQRLADYFQGVLRKYRPEDLKEFLTPKKNDFRKSMAIPKGTPPFESITEYEKIHGRWTRYVFFGDQKLFDGDQDRYYMSFDQKYPLPSHSNYREDVVYRRLSNFVISQEFKEVLQVKQRKDRKLREDFKKKNK